MIILFNSSYTNVGLGMKSSREKINKPIDNNSKEVVSLFDDSEDSLLDDINKSTPIENRQARVNKSSLSSKATTWNFKRPTPSPPIAKKFRDETQIGYMEEDSSSNDSALPVNTPKSAFSFRNTKKLSATLPSDPDPLQKNIDRVASMLQQLTQHVINKNAEKDKENIGTTSKNEVLFGQMVANKLETLNEPEKSVLMGKIFNLLFTT